jgi:hypothetical protein
MASVPGIVLGVIVGIGLNVAIVLLIAWMKDPESPYLFEPRQVRG